MKIWKLFPLDPNSTSWPDDSYKGEVIVRAENEKEARRIAALRLMVLTEQVSICQETPHPPWGDSTVTKCIELDNSKYPTDGPPELLEPKGVAE